MREKPKRTARDIEHSLVRGALSGIPIAGGVASEIFNLIIVPPLTKRRDEWIDSIVEGLNDLEVKVEGFKIEELSKNDSFITTIMHATQAVIRNHQTEKLEALRNAVLNTALATSPREDNIIMIYLNFIESFTPWHIKMLSLFEEHQTQAGLDETLASSLAGKGMDVLVKEIAAISGIRDFDKFVSKELADNKLIILNLTNLLDSHITLFGSNFLKYISSPLKDSN